MEKKELCLKTVANSKIDLIFYSVDYSSRFTPFELIEYLVPNLRCLRFYEIHS